MHFFSYHKLNKYDLRRGVTAVTGVVAVLINGALLSAWGGGAFFVEVVIFSVAGKVVASVGGKELGTGGQNNAKFGLSSSNINKINHANKRSPMLSKWNLNMQSFLPKATILSYAGCRRNVKNT